MTISLQGKTALVTGGSRGIGKSITRYLAQAEASVVIASRKLEQLQATADEFRDLPGKVVPIPCHVGKLQEIENLIRQTEDQLGPIDILVNNSATNLGYGPTLAATDEMLDKIVDINVKAAFRLVRLVVPKMMAQRKGSIINIASIAGLKPMAGMLLYGFTKAGLIMMTKYWAAEFGPQGIRVNAIAPGLIQTDFSQALWQDENVMNDIRARQPIGRMGQPHEVGHLALYLASDESSYVTGQVFAVDGGAAV